MVLPVSYTIRLKALRALRLGSGGHVVGTSARSVRSARWVSLVLAVSGSGSLVLPLAGVSVVGPGSAFAVAGGAAAAVAPGGDDVPEVPSVPLPVLADPVDAADEVDGLPAEATLPENTNESVDPTRRWQRVGELPVKMSSDVRDAAPVVVTWRVPTTPGQDVLRIGVAPDPGTDASAGVARRLPGAGRAPGTPGGGLGEVEVRLGYGDLDHVFGAGWADRLSVTAHPGCYATADPAPGCLAGWPVEVVRDPAKKTLTWDAAPSPLASSGRSAAPRQGQQGGRVAPGAAGGGAGGVVFSVAGSAGAYGATPLPISSGWQVGEGSGEFGFTYPFAMPAALGGATPELGLAYSSGSEGRPVLEDPSTPSRAGGWSRS
jgi:hypothetical protein